DYLRISLTDNCNFRCRYCMPEEEMQFHPDEQLMQPDEIEALAKIFVQLGTRKIRLTGGEPLVRKDAGNIIERLAALPVQLTLTTNGFLADRYIDLFHASNIRSLNISIDSLSPEKFLAITRRDKFDTVWKNILTMVEQDFHVKLNCVVMEGVNDDELLDFVALTKDLPVHVRFIEFMPFTGNHWNNKAVFTWQQMLERISGKFLFKKLSDEPNDTAKKYQVPGHAGTFAVISTMSAPFCSTCNRMRLTADGKMKNCLFSAGETDLLTALRKGDDVEAMIRKNLDEKQEMMGGQFTDYSVTNPDEIQNRTMISIGG
ncbi:MAG TPA: GTP 3',8-cyclase MoaA, partial [Chitinophagales bacterium]|nr:GTP 3',8-cyclase MoaA [Chitinophagales bacterium]